MKALITGQDYTLMLKRGARELQRLRKEKLEAPLKQAYDPARNLGKVVTLELVENRGAEGIELTFLPKDAKSWESIKTIQVKLNHEAYDRVEQDERFGTRYDGSNKIDIVNGLLEEL